MSKSRSDANILNLDNIESGSNYLNLENDLNEIVADSGKVTLDPELLNKELDELIEKWDEEDTSNEVIDKYISRFEEQVNSELVTVGGATLDQIKVEEKKLQQIEIDTRREKANLEKTLAENELRREREAELRLQYQIQRRKNEIDRKKNLFLLQQKIQRQRMRQAMRKSESHLKWALTLRRGEVQKEYGALEPTSDTVSSTIKALPKWSVEWKKTPQPVELNIVTVRGVKDKLPPGKFVLVVSIYDHMAGHALRWSAWENRRKVGQASIPIGHDGSFKRPELKFDQKLYCALPAKSDMRPSMVFTFELFMIRGDLSPFDRVVAWGAYPICNEHFDVLQGKCRCPMLRGPMRQNIDRFEKIQQLINKDLDNWLANLYFDVKLLPKFTSGQKEIRVRTKFKQSTMAILDHVREYTRPTKKYQQLEEEKSLSNEDRDDEDDLTLISPDFDPTSSTSKRNQTQPQSTKDVYKNWWSQSEEQNNTSQSSTSKKNIVSELDNNQFMSPAANLLITNSENTTIATPFVPEVIRQQQDLGIAEVYSRRHNFDPDRAYNDQAEDLLTAHEDRLGHDIFESWKDQPKTLSYNERLEQHYMAVRRQETNLGMIKSPVLERARFTGRMFLGELGLLYINSVEFWWTWILLIACWFAQLYIHYLFQYAFFAMIGQQTAISVFKLEAYTVDLVYQTDQLNLGQTTTLVLFGPLGNIILYFLLMLFFWAAQKSMMGLPFVLSKLMLAYGIWTFINPISTLIVDSILYRWVCGTTKPIGDAFKIYCYLSQTTAEGGLGIPITILLYIACLVMAGTLLYFYLLVLHNNGRMLDCWWRLTSKEKNFLVPYDLEVSQQQLSYLINKAEQWRGSDGQRRKTTIANYVLESDDTLKKLDDNGLVENNNVDDDGFLDQEGIKNLETASRFVETGRNEVTTHIAIYTLHLDGLKELYRQFLRLPDGAVVEIFGDIATAMLGSPDLKQALIKKQRQLEDDLDQDIKNMSSNLVERMKSTFSGKGLSKINELDENEATNGTTHNVNFEDQQSNSSGLRRRNTQGQNNSAFMGTEMDEMQAKSEITHNKINVNDNASTAV